MKRGNRLLILSLVISLASCTSAHAETPTEWWRIVTEIEKQQDRLDDEEKRFVRNVINRLSLHEDAVPTPEHAQWLRNLKRKLDIK